MEPSDERRTLLVVDDDAETRYALHETLEEHGYRVATSPDGHDALIQLQYGLRPDVLLVDLCMPGMDGWTLVAKLRERAELAHIPVVVMTASSARLLNAAPPSAGYVTKPFDLSTLVETLEKCQS